VDGAALARIRCSYAYPISAMDAVVHVMLLDGLQSCPGAIFEGGGQIDGTTAWRVCFAT